MQDDYVRIIIDIPKDTYEYVLEGAETSLDEIMVMDAIRNSNIIDTNNELHNTIYGMISDDYKAKLKAEYEQVSIRLDKLNNYLTTNDIDMEHWELLAMQRTYMIRYANILERRLALLGVSID